MSDTLSSDDWCFTLLVCMSYHSPPHVWWSLAPPTRIILGFRCCNQHHPVSLKWLTTAGLVCIVSAYELAWSHLAWTSTHKLLITDVSQCAWTKCIRAYRQIVHILLVLTSEVDCHWNNINSDGTRCTSCQYAECAYNRHAYRTMLNYAYEAGKAGNGYTATLLWPRVQPL